VATIGYVFHGAPVEIELTLTVDQAVRLAACRPDEED
jgi:hypothetical protein